MAQEAGAFSLAESGRGGDDGHGTRDQLVIATGVIEGACRRLLKDRVDITGARWRLTGAKVVLKLRSSGDSEAYWDFHKAQELKRSHSSPIKNCPLLEAA